MVRLVIFLRRGIDRSSAEMNWCGVVRSKNEALNGTATDVSSERGLRELISDGLVRSGS
jgi:hypothetical protein